MSQDHNQDHNQEPNGHSLPPLAQSFPNSQKTSSADELLVPARKIDLTNGEHVNVYDTTGPQGHDPEAGLPRRRQPWIDQRIQRGDTNFSQMHYARSGVVTEEMRFCAIR